MGTCRRQRTPRWVFPVTASAALACGAHARLQVLDAFEAARAEALASPAPLATEWQPDVRVRLGGDAVASALTQALRGQGFERSFDMKLATLSPSLSVQRVRLVDPATPGNGHLGVEVLLEGAMGVDAGPLEGRPALSVLAVLDTALDVENGKDGWAVTAATPSLRGLYPQLRSEMVRNLVTPVLERLGAWVLDRMGAPGTSWRVVRLGDLSLPLRGLRVGVLDGTVTLDGRSESPSTAVAALPPYPGEGWSGTAAVPSVLAVARAALFRRSPLGDDLFAEPRDLRLQDGRFGLDLRLWRVGDRSGWWRDYTVEGQTSLEGDALQLTDAHAVETGASYGAGWVDPIATLARGAILRQIEGAVTASVPTARTEDIPGVAASWRLQGVQRVADDLVATGQAQFTMAAADASRP